MSERAELKLVQIVVDVGDGSYYAVDLRKDRHDFLISYIAALCEGPIKLVKLPGVKMVPIEELTDD